MRNLINFLDQLEKANIYYCLNKVRDGVMVEIAVPGERWEVEFMRDGEIQVERFLSKGTINGKEELDILFNRFAD